MERETDVEERALQHTLKGVQCTSGDQIDPCVICLDSISERAIAVPCRHIFDFLCLVSWLERRSSCPLCKTQVSSVEYDFFSSNDFKVFNVPSQPPVLPADTSYSSSTSTGLRLYHRRPRPNRRALPTPSPDEALLRRRQVYRRNLYSLHVGSNRISKYRDLSPQLFSRDQTLVSRARQWIRRELSVFDFLNPDNGDEIEGVTRRTNNAEFLLEYIIAILKTVDIKGSGGQAEDMLQEFLGRDSARLFWHELRAWLRSPYMRLDDWDQHVQYSEPLDGSYLRQGKPKPVHACSPDGPSRPELAVRAAYRMRNDRYSQYYRGSRYGD